MKCYPKCDKKDLTYEPDEEIWVCLNCGKVHKTETEQDEE